MAFLSEKRKPFKDLQKGNVNACLVCVRSLASDSPRPLLAIGSSLVTVLQRLQLELNLDHAQCCDGLPVPRRARVALAPLFLEDVHLLGAWAGRRRGRRSRTKQG